MEHELSLSYSLYDRLFYKKPHAGMLTQATTKTAIYDLIFLHQHSTMCQQPLVQSDHCKLSSTAQYWSWDDKWLNEMYIIPTGVTGILHFKSLLCLSVKYNQE